MSRRPPRSPLFPYPPLFRSGDDRRRRGPHRNGVRWNGGGTGGGHRIATGQGGRRRAGIPRPPRRHPPERRADNRSEEHTSELQSLAYLVCRLLLEKKKKKHV